MFNEESDKVTILDHIVFFSKNKIPLDSKGDAFTHLHYMIEDYKTLSSLFDALIRNDHYKGSLRIKSNNFDDIIGYKVAEIISKNKLKELLVENRTKPFSDRISLMIGDALESNTNLRSLGVYLQVSELSPVHLCKFLKNSESNLESISFMQIDKNLFDGLSKYINKSSKLKHLGFYYEPLKYVDLLYELTVNKETYHRLADTIQNDSNVVSVDLIPRFEEFDPEINQKLSADVYELAETLKFSCEINEKEKQSQLDIESTYNEENNKMSEIM